MKMAHGANESVSNQENITWNDASAAAHLQPKPTVFDSN